MQACPGFNLTLICSAVGNGSTVYHGNLLNCTSNEITLLHSRFNRSSTGGTNGTCNNGKITGQSLSVNDSSNCYTSYLHIMVTPDTIGKSITCTYDNGTATKEIGSFSIETTQCHTMTVTTVTPTTGKPLIHKGALIIENYILNYMQQFQCLYRQQQLFTKTLLNLIQLCTHVTKVHDIVYLTA